MSCCSESVFHKSLFYSSPAHGGWGVLKTAHLVPESYYLFVSPAACGRHGALGACMDGRKERVSYLYLKEEDIVSGGYEELMIQGVQKLLAHLEKCGRMPKVLGIFVSCIDDLLGTDHGAILSELSMMYPHVRFTVCHMNPTSTDTSVPPAVNIQNKNYSVLEVTDEKDGGINIIGNLAPLRENGDLFKVLEEMGAAAVRHISDYQSFDKYQEMAKSKLNLVITPSGKYAAANMSKKHGIPHQLVFTTFQIEKIRENYEKIAELLGVKCPDLEIYEQSVREALEKTRKHLNGRSIVLDCEAIVRPFDLTKALIKAGIHVEGVFAQQAISSDKENFEWVKEYAPELKIIQPQSPEASLRNSQFEKCVAIGYSAAYLSGTSHLVDIDGQHGLYGYQGLIDLLEMICKAADEETNLKKVLDEAVLVV